MPCAIEADKPVGGQDLEVGRMKVLATTVGRTDEDPLLQTETASFSDVSRLSQLRRCFWRRCVDSVADILFQCCFLQCPHRHCDDLPGTRSVLAQPSPSVQGNGWGSSLERAGGIAHSPRPRAKDQRKRQRKRERDGEEKREREKERERERERKNATEAERARESERERQRKRKRERLRGRGRERKREKEGEKERARKKERKRQREREREKDKETEKEKDSKF